uniref:Retrotransposon gag protein n=1 Tax=Rhabditophanes sp. KR3021 TaxID=114890 RepID=A0AC35TZ77_9BILA
MATTTAVKRDSIMEQNHDEAMDLFHAECAANKLALSSTQLKMPNHVKITNSPVVLMIAPATVISQQSFLDKGMNEVMGKLNINENKSTH